jgi:tRNA1Val (adenine37-N6)-methyltransferase
MSNSYFQFKQFMIRQDRCAMKVCTDSCLFGAWLRGKLSLRDIHVDRMLDIGTGTGLLTMILMQAPSFVLQADAIEIDEFAAGQASENILAAGKSQVINVHCKPLQQFEADNNYDLIVSNPPFFVNDLRGKDIARTRAMHEDTLELEEIFDFAIKKMSSNGRLALMVPFHRKEELMNMVASNGLWVESSCAVKQTHQHDYFRYLLVCKNAETDVAEEESIVIKEKDGQYSSSFIRLLKEFYLYL